MNGFILALNILSIIFDIALIFFIVVQLIRRHLNEKIKKSSKNERR